jgi:hypothetical protein
MGERGGMHHGGMQHEGPMFEIWEMLTEEQKKKVVLMKMDMKIQWMEMKIAECQKMAELKKKAIENIKSVQEMIKQGK